MPQVANEYEQVDEFQDIGKALIDSLPTVFPDVDKDDFMDNIRLVVIKNKDRKKGSIMDSVKIDGISYPARMFADCGYVVTLYKGDWENMTDEQKQAITLYILRRLPQESGKDGKLLPLDFKDDGLLVRTFGPDYLESDDLPNIVEQVKKGENIDWVLD